MGIQRRTGLRVAFICQAADRSDPIQASTVRWIEALARHEEVDRVAVLSMRAGDPSFQLPIEVSAFGRSRKPLTLAAFYRAVFRLLWMRPDFFFVHQTGPYPLLLYPFKLLLGIPIVQWVAHPAISRASSFYAKWLDDLVITSARASFPTDHPKVRVMGQGVDPEVFRPRDTAPTGDLITVGRIAPRKRIDAMIAAVARANQDYGATFTLDVFGPMLPGDRSYATRLEELIAGVGCQESIRLHGPVPQERLPELLGSHRAYLNFSETALDRSVVEAMACGLPVISTNDAVTEILPMRLHPALITDKERTDVQARTIHQLLAQPAAEIDELGGQMRALAIREHGVDRLFDRILEETAPLLRIR